jgi:hypothetical protein
LETRMTFRIFGLSLAIVALAFTSVDAKTVTRACKKNISTGMLSYDVSDFSSDYIIDVKSFKQTSRDANWIYGMCTIKLTYSPPD